MGSFSKVFRQEHMELLFLLLGSLIWVVAPTRGDLATDLRSSTTMEVFMPGHKDFEFKRAVMNAACTDQPAVIVVPRAEQDIRLALETAAKYGLDVSVRS